MTHSYDRRYNIIEGRISSYTDDFHEAMQALDRGATVWEGYSDWRDTDNPNVQEVIRCNTRRLTKMDRGPM